MLLGVVDGDAAGHAADGSADDAARDRAGPPLPVAQRAPGAQEDDQHSESQNPLVTHDALLLSVRKRLAARNAKPITSQ